MCLCVFFFFNGDLPLRQGIACTAVSLQIRLITTLKPPQKKKKPPSRGPRTVFDEGEDELLFFFFFDAMPTPALLFGKKARFFFSPHGTTFERSTVHSPLYGKKKRKSAVSNGHHFFFFFHSVVSFVLQLKVYLSDTPFFFPSLGRKNSVNVRRLKKNLPNVLSAARALPLLFLFLPFRSLLSCFL